MEMNSKATLIFLMWFMHISGAKTPLVEGDMAMPVSLFQTLHLSVIAFVLCLVTSLDTCSAKIKAFIFIFIYSLAEMLL